MKITKIKIIASTEDKYLDSLFDAKNGYGACPNNESIDYFGFTVYMTPSEFLGLASFANLKPEFYEHILKEGEPIGYPFLCVFEEDGIWKIWGHEGRHRVQAIKNLFGDNHLVPVQIFPRSMRNRDITPTYLSMPFLPEKKDIGPMTLREAHSILKYFPLSRIDLHSKKLRVGVIKRNTNYKHPALANSKTIAAQWVSDLNRTHSPCELKPVNTNEDDVTEVVDDVHQPMHVYKNASIAPTGHGISRRGN